MRLGWVDFSREARKRAFEALAALSEPGAVDELGFGPLRDAFADALFPGTSTLQTRAKYFVLVPCAIRYALENGKPLRQVERECCRQMWNTCGHSGKAGVIGNRGLNNGAEWIQRPPSEVYWAGLRKMGILETSLAPGLWFAHASRLAAEASPRSGTGKREEGIDDDRETGFSGWKRDFDFRLWQDIYSDFKENLNNHVLSPDLTSKEAGYLREQILRAEGMRGSLLAWCLEHKRIPQASETDGDAEPSGENLSPFFRFSRSIRSAVPPELGTLLDAANAFNRLVFPARVLHNKLLAVAEIDTVGLWKKIENDIPGWAAAVDLPSIFALFPGRVSESLDGFLNRLQRAFRDRDFASAAELVKNREKAIKQERAKVLEQNRVKLPPGKWVGGGWLDYRLSIAGRILRDIASSLPGDTDV